MKRTAVWCVEQCVGKGVAAASNVGLYRIRLNYKVLKSSGGYFTVHG